MALESTSLASSDEIIDINDGFNECFNVSFSLCFSGAITTPSGEGEGKGIKRVVGYANCQC